MDRHLLSDRNLHRLSVVHVPGSWVVRRTLDHRLRQANHSWGGGAGRDKVTARRKAVDAVLAEIVGQNPIEKSKRYPLVLSSSAWSPRKPERAHRNARLWLAVVIGDA